MLQDTETTKKSDSRKTGNKQNVAVNDPTVNELLKDNINRLSAGEGGGLEAVTIQSITRQIVAGMKYEIIGMFKVAGSNRKCTVTIWSRAWVDDPAEKTKIKADCENVKVTDTTEAENEAMW